MTSSMQNKSNEYWKKKLSPDQYNIARLGGTEAPFTGKYVDNHEAGIYRCIACGQELFSSDTKFDSDSGWPSFTDPMNTKHVELKKDYSMGLSRTEVICANCGSHLGHVFDDGPAEKGGKRYCINSVCLKFDEK